VTTTLATHSHGDPSLRTGEGGLTVWTLQEMAKGKRFSELDDLFNNGLTMDTLPVGLAAGTPYAMLDQKFLAKLLNFATIDTKYLKLDSNQAARDTQDYLTENNWRGKMFFPSNNKRVSEGRNRIRKSLADQRSPIIPMAKFDTMLLESHPLAAGAKSNVVVLSYAHPQTRPYLMEFVISKVQVYDIMVAVKGKYGPVFVGKTWLGKYDKNGNFSPSNPDQLIARYFLDFNEGAIKEQRAEHWDGSDEELLDPIPYVEN
jgi:hypothetical protein